MHEAEARLRLLAELGDTRQYSGPEELHFDESMLRADIAWLLNEREQLDEALMALRPVIKEDGRAFVLAGVKAGVAEVSRFVENYGEVEVTDADAGAIAESVLRALNAKEVVPDAGADDSQAPGLRVATGTAHPEAER